MSSPDAHYCTLCGAELVRNPKERPAHFSGRQHCGKTCANRENNIKARKVPLCGVYEIRNTVNGKVYIGSSVNIRERWYKHRKLLRGGKHNSAHLQSAWSKYGPHAFAFTVIEIVDSPEHLITKEQEWLDRTRCSDAEFGYNGSPTAFSCLGVKHTEESKQRMAAASQERAILQRGSLHHLTHLCEQDALQIRQDYADGATQASLANRHGVSIATVRSICSGETWTHVGGPLRISAKQRDALNGGKMPRPPKPQLEIRHESKAPGNAKLSESDVITIKELLVSGKTGNEIAKMFDVNRSTIRKIRAGIAWTHVGGPQPTPGKSRRIDLYLVIGSARKMSKLTESDVIDIKQRLTNGERPTAIGRLYGVAPATISLIRSGRNWSHVPWPDPSSTTLPPASIIIPDV